MPWYAYTYLHHTHLYNWRIPSCNIIICNCFKWYLQWTVSVLPERLRVVHLRSSKVSSPILPTILTVILMRFAVRTCLTSHIWSISFHTMPLVINSLTGRHTHTCTQTCILISQTKESFRNRVCTWFHKKIYLYWCIRNCSSVGIIYWV